MDVLSRSSAPPVASSRAIWQRLVCVLAALVTTVVVTSCLVSPGSSRGFVPSRFDHSVHVGGRELECSFCHAVRQDGTMQKPGPQLCIPCHKQLGLGPESLDVETLFDESGHYRASHVADLPDGLRFQHRVHTARTECATCHGDIATSSDIPLPSIGKDDCMDCHAESGASNECSTCHENGIDRDWKPSTHDTAWTRQHGFAVRARDDATENRCDLCHQEEQSCNNCHRHQLPQSHTNFFRIRGHGIQSSIDRQSCATCHRTDFCDRCHQSTAPRSHRAGFGAPRNRHCTGCHFPLQDSGCATCHKAVPQHQGTSLPPGHNPAMNCRLCHGNGVFLPHPDNGTECTACHR